MSKSYEENVEDIIKRDLNNSGTKYYSKTESINPSIDNALLSAVSKGGGDGGNFPDIRLMLSSSSKDIPVMIEVKGGKGLLVKADDSGNILNRTKEGNPNFINIKRYAVNGALHYAEAILNYAYKEYDEVVFIGINGYKENESDKDIKIEVSAYYLGKKSQMREVKLADYSDVSFLYLSNQNAFLNKIKNVGLSQEEIDKIEKEQENRFSNSLKELNQKLHDELNISVGYRIKLVSGMIMAGLGIGDVKPLMSEDLHGENDAESSDGNKIFSKITAFLKKKNLPEDKVKVILNELKNAFLNKDNWMTKNGGESKLKIIYRFMEKNILPIIRDGKHIDFTGQLFNVMNEWVDVPDGQKNDVVLTPRYVTNMMAKLCQVNMNSYVWDFAAGTGGFLISAMNLMIQDASKIEEPEKRKEKIESIKRRQLLGIEKLPDVYLLAVLNMIIMGDGSSHFLHEDSLNEFDGTYTQGGSEEENKEKFPADVFLLNPPYSAEGKGFVFVEKALNRMQKGKACVLIQENAGAGKGLPYTKRLLEKNTLLASIHMADIFRGKAGVQTAVYLFDVGTPHNEKQLVKFINMENDGYSRQNRKKSKSEKNLRDTDHAKERYEEVVNLILYGKKYLHYYTKDDYIEDTISLDGNDWTFKQHKTLDTTVTLEDFKKTVSDYLSWKVSTIIKNKGEDSLGK